MTETTYNSRETINKYQKPNKNYNNNLNNKKQKYKKNIETIKI